MSRMFSDDTDDGFRREVAPLTGASLPAFEVDISLYDTGELLLLRNRIDSMLPPMTMASMNLEEEIVKQFMTVQALQSKTLAGNDESNKKAAVVNACASALQNLAKLQIELHTAERFKTIENLIIKHVKSLPLETAQKFMDDYSNLTYA